MLLSLYAKATTFAWGVREGVRDRMSNEDGAVATEYGLLLVLIALVIITAVAALGLAIKAIFFNSSSQLGGSGG
jgi:Flp pilus assembly pilin Flp